jgi:hypothetical protein
MAAVALVTSAEGWAQSADEVRALLDRGQAAAAYELGRRAPERLGEPAFDLAFGVAAINSGRPGEGVLALERYLLLNPGDEGARVELARGYFLLGDDARAKEEFELALSRRPPANVARVIRDFLGAIAERESRRRPTLAGHVELGGGYDSNPRAGVDSALITLPVIGEVTVPDSGVRSSDRLWRYGAGVRGSLPLTRRLALFVSGQADGVRHISDRDFDQQLFAGSAGLYGKWDEHMWRVGVSRGYQKLDRQPYRHVGGLFLDWGHAIGARDVMSAGLQGGKLEYADANAVRDADFAVAVVGLRHAFGWAWQTVLDVAVNAGRERNVSEARQDLSRDLYGARLAIAVTPSADWTLSASALYQRSRYLEPDALLETTRADRYAAGELGIAWALTARFTLRAELTEARNRSNLALFEYRRRTAMLRGRYEFR